METKFEEKEEWRPIVGFEGLYEVCSLGNVRRVGKAARQGKGRGGGARIGLILKPQPRKDGYIHVQLWKEGKPEIHLVHCLVAEAFLGPAPLGYEVNHQNGRKEECYVSNLEYVTRSENNLHAYRTGLRQPKVEQLVAARRKPHKIIECACGCGLRFETPDNKGRLHKFIWGHNARKKNRRNNYARN